jgi:putative tricarboxylic transport membrane protein
MRAGSADLWSGLALGGLGAYIIAQASRWEYLGADGPGPGFFPLWYGIAIVALSLVLVISSVTNKTSEKVEWAGAGRALTAWAAFAACVALLKVAGFLVCFAALTFFIVAVMYRRPLKVAAAVAVCGTAAFYVIFPLALGVALP